MAAPLINSPEKSTELTPSFLGRVEKATMEKVANMLGIPVKPKAEKLKQLTPEQEAQLREIEGNAIANFQGDLDQLEAALGMLRLGHHVGWRVLYMVHSKRTIRIYEDILKIKVRDIFEDTGPSSYRSIGFNLASRFSNFWKVAGGEIKIPRRKDTTL
jgi:hypothetical protein